MIANKSLSFQNQAHFGARTLAKPHVSGNYGNGAGAFAPAVLRPISTKHVDKFVDYR
jgi:hypothetical protein